MKNRSEVGVEDFLTRLASNFDGSKSRPPSVAMLLKKIKTYKALGLSEAEIPDRIGPKPKFNELQRSDAVSRYSSRLNEAGLNHSEFNAVMRDLRIDSFEGLLRVNELKKILSAYVGSATMSSKEDGISRLQKRFDDRLAA